MIQGRNKYTNSKSNPKQKSLEKQYIDQSRMLTTDIYFDMNQDEQSAFKPNQDLDTVRSAQSKPIPNPQIVSDSPLEMVNYQLSGLPLQIPRAFSTVMPSEAKKVKTDITGLMQEVENRVAKLEAKHAQLQTQIDTKWNDVMQLIGKIIEKQGDEGLNESAVNSLHEKIYLQQKEIDTLIKKQHIQDAHRALNEQKLEQAKYSMDKSGNSANVKIGNLVHQMVHSKLQGVQKNSAYEETTSDWNGRIQDLEQIVGSLQHQFPSNKSLSEQVKMEVKKQ